MSVCFLVQDFIRNTQYQIIITVILVYENSEMLRLQKTKRIKYANL